MVPLGTLDLGVDGGKSAVDIPFVGPTEACLHVASLIGDRFGVMVFHPNLVTFSAPLLGAMEWKIESLASASAVSICRIWLPTMTKSWITL